MMLHLLFLLGLLHLHIEFVLFNSLIMILLFFLIIIVCSYCLASYTVLFSIVLVHILLSFYYLLLITSLRTTIVICEKIFLIELCHLLILTILVLELALFEDHEIDLVLISSNGQIIEDLELLSIFYQIFD